MADTLCGPSNALQSFQKHAQVDRTLQQDRLVGSRQSPSQGFRSFDPRAGSLDADFHAFENAAPNPFQFQDPLFNGGQQRLPVFQQAQPQASGWATDFSRLNISEQPMLAHQFRTEAPLMKSAQGGWQSEFMRHREGQMSPVAQGKSVASNYAQTHEPFYGMSSGMQYQMPGQLNSYMPQSNMSQFQDASTQQQNQHMTNTAAVDWSQAFEEAYSNAIETEQIGNEQMLHQDGVYTNDHTQEEEAFIREPENIKIGSDAIDYTETKDRTAEQASHDSNALARVAGELLHNVQGDSSEKFQNSQFLDLMRKIRDKQVEIRNNDFETTGTDTARSGTQDKVQRQWHSEASAQAEHASQSNQANFQFPDLNAVYEPELADVTDYSFDPDDYSYHGPQTQMQALHPGGRLYPGSSEQRETHMSGGIGSIPANEFDTVDENRAFASRYSRPTVGPDPEDMNIA